MWRMASRMAVLVGAGPPELAVYYGCDRSGAGVQPAGVVFGASSRRWALGIGVAVSVRASTAGRPGSRRSVRGLSQFEFGAQPRVLRFQLEDLGDSGEVQPGRE